MAEFVYRAADSQGKIVSGRVQAGGRDQALVELRGKGLTPIQIDEAVGDGGASASLDRGMPSPRLRTGMPWRDTAPNGADVHHLTTELAVMLRAGLQLDRALRVLIDMSGKPSVTAMLEDILRSVKGGKGLSQALSPHQSVFGDFYISMIRSGEVGGHLAQVLERLVEHLERAKELRESAISALIYPAILVVVAVLSVALMLGFVVPQFEGLFSDLGDALPMPTRMIVSLGHFVGAWGWLVALLATAGAHLVWRGLQSPGGRRWRDGLLLRAPLVGELVRKYQLTLFARSMGTLLGNGVPIVNAMRIASDTVANHQLRAALEGVVPAIKGGRRMGEALEPTRLFSPLALNMVRLGEETGRLDTMLLELARVTDRDVQSGIKRLLTLIEPLLILAMGGVIAMIIMSILMGILAVNDLAA